MEKETATYCLLCAQLKCISTLIQLQADDEVFRITIEKLSRLNILYDLDEILPKTICIPCNDNLDRAFEFVAGVEKAQHILNNLYKNQIKTENISLEDQKFDILDDKSDYCVSIKEENYTHSSDDSSVFSDRNSSISRESPKNNKVRKNSRNSNITSWSDYLWTCSLCETQFATNEELKIHSMQYHQCCNALKCNDCSIKKLHLNRFIVHVQRHRKHLKLLCYKCNSEFFYSYELNDHIKTAHAPKTNYVCHGCNADFETPEELQQHTQTFFKGKRLIHIPVELQSSTLTCIICKKSFKSKVALNNHLLIHTDRKREHTCEKCGKCFFNKQHLAGHMLLHDDIRSYQCKICKCSFKTSRQLKAHVAIHDGEKPHTCDQCGKGFRLKRHLNSHKIIHTDSLPHGCSYCDKKFRFKSILNQHIRQHTGVKPYSCEICVKDFTNWPNYNKHMKRRHNLDMAKKKRTPEGVYPINPSTGKIIKHEDTNETLEWKKQILKRRAKGRPSSHKKLQINALDGLSNDKLEIK